MKKSLIFLVLASLIIAGCTKEEIIQFPPDQITELLFLDSVKVDPNGTDFERIKLDNRKPILRGEKTMIFSRTMTLNIYEALDFYIPKNQLEADMRYTTIMTPIKGNPNLNICSHLPTRIPSYRMIDDDFKDGVEKLSCTRDVLLPNEIELNFLVKGKIGDSFHWEIYKEPIPSVDTSIVDPGCTCGDLGSQIIVCEGFETYIPNSPAATSPYFIEHNLTDGKIMLNPNQGNLSDAYLFIEDETSTQTESRLTLGKVQSENYKLTFTFNLEDSGKAIIRLPFASARFIFNSAHRGNLTLFNNYKVGFNIPDEEWIEFELMFDMARNLYRFEIGNIYYFWQTTPANFDQDLQVRFLGTNEGYRIDNLCFEQLPR